MLASYKFIQKLWGLHQKIKNIIEGNINTTEEKDVSEELNKFSNQVIFKITNNIEKFSYNVIIANLHEIYNFLSKQITFQIKKEILKKNYFNILILMSPIIPHFAQECLESLNIKKNKLASC